MDTFFQLLDLDSGNVVGEFDTKVDALLAVGTAEETYGKDAIRDLSLMVIANGVQAVVAMEDGLVDLLRELQDNPVLTASTTIRIGFDQPATRVANVGYVTVSGLALEQSGSSLRYRSPKRVWSKDGLVTTTHPYANTAAAS